MLRFHFLSANPGQPSAVVTKCSGWFTLRLRAGIAIRAFAFRLISTAQSPRQESEKNEKSNTRSSSDLLLFLECIQDSEMEGINLQMWSKFFNLCFQWFEPCTVRRET
jgi:hypothetical protein